MTTPFQSGIVAEPSSSALFITLDINRTEICAFKAALAVAPAFITEFQHQ